MLYLRRAGLLFTEDKKLMNVLVDNGYYISPKCGFEGKYGRSFEIYQLIDGELEDTRIQKAKEVWNSHEDIH